MFSAFAGVKRECKSTAPTHLTGMVTRRNRDEGRPGHPTRFAPTARAESSTPLSVSPNVTTPKCVSASTYFPDGGDDITCAPIIIVDAAGRERWCPLYDEFWDKQPVVEIVLNGLHRTQDSLFTKHLDHHATPGLVGADDDRDLPLVVEHDGKRWILDGHHRLAAAMDRGETTASVRFYDFQT